MISGSSSVEALLPGSPAAIQTVIETVSSGIAPAQAIGNAWQMMTIPTWQGNAATSWAAFAPREAGHHSATPAAMRRASSAMLRYQAAFQIARTEIVAAIADAARAEQATASARADHQSAVRKANQAEPGSPEAKVPSYTDPGASGLAAAETRYATAVAAFQRTGDEVAAEITAASYTTSGVRPAIMAPPGYKPDIDLSRGWDFFRGFFLQLGDAVVGLLELTWMMTPPGMVQYLIENCGYLFEGPEGWARHDAEMRELWESGAIWQSFANAFLAADKWEDHPYEAAGRVTFEGLSLLIGVLKAPKIVSAARAARPASVARRFPTVKDLATGFFGKENAGQPIRVGGKELKDLGRSNNPGYVRVVDGTAFGSEAKLQKAVLAYAEELAGKPLRPVGPAHANIKTAEITRPDGTKFVINVREVSSSAGVNDANVKLTLELIDSKNWEAHGWPNHKVELKFGWVTE